MNKNQKLAAKAAAKTQKKQRDDRILTIVLLSFLAIFFIGASAFIIHSNIAYSELRDLAQYSNADHGATIEEFIQNVGDEEFEHIALFNLKGEKLFEYTMGSDAAIELPDPVFVRLFGDHQRQDIITVHNHPGEFETPFSTTDMHTINNDNPYIEQIVSTRSRVFILRQNDTGWPTRVEVNLYLENIKYELNQGRLGELFVFDDATGNLYAGDGFVQDFADTFNLRYNQTTVDNFKFTDWTP